MSALFSKPDVPEPSRPAQDRDSILAAKLKERQRLAGARGRGSTKLGGSTDEGVVGQTSLLGGGRSPRASA